MMFTLYLLARDVQSVSYKWKKIKSQSSYHMASSLRAHATEGAFSSETKTLASGILNPQKSTSITWNDLIQTKTNGALLHTMPSIK